MGLYGLVTFLGIALMMMAEPVLARNRLTHPRCDRWLNNIGFGFANELIRVSSPLFLSLLFVGAAWRPLDASALGFFGGAAVAFIVLDLSTYWLHRISHRVPWLWRLHLTHHCDLDLDVTTSIRHHPAEYLVNLVVFSLIIGLLGFTPSQVLPYVLVYQGISLWSHSNLRVPERLELATSWFLVSPRIHQIHHSAWRPQTDSNYGQVLTLWDRLFGTYISPSLVNRPARFGLETFRSDQDQRMAALMLQPIRRAPQKSVLIADKSGKEVGERAQ